MSHAYEPVRPSLDFDNLVVNELKTKDRWLG